MPFSDRVRTIVEYFCLFFLCAAPLWRIKDEYILQLWCTMLRILSKRRKSKPLNKAALNSSYFLCVSVRPLCYYTKLFLHFILIGLYNCVSHLVAMSVVSTVNVIGTWSDRFSPSTRTRWLLLAVHGRIVVSSRPDFYYTFLGKWKYLNVCSVLLQSHTIIVCSEISVVHNCMFIAPADEELRYWT